MKIGIFCLHNLGITPFVLAIVLVVFKRDEDWSVSCYVLTQLGKVLYFGVVMSPAIFDF